jgi:hypothetical protein
MPLRIAFGYKARSGKDTAVDYLIQKLGGVRLRNAESLYEVCSDIQIKIGVEVKKDPLLLQEVGMMVRGIYGVDVWVNTQIAKLNSTENFFVSDLRFKNEFKKYKENGFILVKIDRDASLRANDRDSKHISEVDLDDAEFDIIIKNNGMLEEFYKKIDEIIEVILRREQYPLTK